MIDERVALSLDNMRQAAADAVGLLKGKSESDFSHQLACAMCLVIIGEATARIEKRSPSFVAAHSDWPWHKVRGLRNLIVHDYDKLELPIIWLTVTESLPTLLAKIEELGELDPRLWPAARHNGS